MFPLIGFPCVWGRTYLETSCLVSWWLPECASWLADFWLATVWRHRFIFLADGTHNNRCVHKLLHTHYLTGFHMQVWWHDDSISNISGLVQPFQMAYPDPLEMHESPSMNEIDKQWGNTVHVSPRKWEHIEVRTRSYKYIQLDFWTFSWQL